MSEETTTTTETTTVEQDGVHIDAGTPEVHIPVEADTQTETHTETTMVEKE